jgi:hypothetical protein
MKTLLNAGLLMAVAMAPWSLAWGAEWKLPVPKEPVVKVYVEKSEYRLGEPVQFMIYKHSPVSKPNSKIMCSVVVKGANMATRKARRTMGTSSACVTIRCSCSISTMLERIGRLAIPLAACRSG